MSKAVDTLVFQLRAVGMPEAEREVCFHPTRKWRFDVCWSAYRVAVEVDGAVYAQGRHTRGEGYEEDCLKFAEAALLGWQVLRFSTGQVRSGLALYYIEQILTDCIKSTVNRKE